uniref:tRNA lysidine(34) synthetase TilS n=1 Tax=Paenibacillus phytorum TaxID=2654977 RepID=UPI0035E446DA
MLRLEFQNAPIKRRIKRIRQDKRILLWNRSTLPLTSFNFTMEYSCQFSVWIFL